MYLTNLIYPYVFRYNEDEKDGISLVLYQLLNSRKLFYFSLLFSLELNAEEFQRCNYSYKSRLLCLQK